MIGCMTSTQKLGAQAKPRLQRSATPKEVGRDAERGLTNASERMSPSNAVNRALGQVWVGYSLSGSLFCLHPPFRIYLIQPMGRSKSVNWRAARQAARLSEIKPYTSKPAYLGIGRFRGTHPSSVAYPCSYCSFAFRSEAEILRHLVLTPVCREQHRAAIVSRTQLLRVQLALGVPDGHQPDAVHNVPNEKPPLAPPSNHASTSTSSAPADVPHDPLAQDPTQNGSNGLPESNGSFQDGRYVEVFPDRCTGAPISEKTKPEEDLEAYIQACGRLGKQANFETMELLMTTGLSNAGRDRHLKSRMVSLQVLQHHFAAYQSYSFSMLVERHGRTVKAC
jgi:hypothetical protein